MMPRLYYFHDPMCSWCWGYRPTWQRLKAQLAESVEVVNVLGGLAPDTDEPMPQPLQDAIEQHWRTIAQQLGTAFNFDFWTQNQPRRATHKACRAVLAASFQGHEEAMIEAIQRAYYLRAMNPSDTSVLIQLAEDLRLDGERFRVDLQAEQTHRLLNEQLAFARRAPIAGFPSLVLEIGGEQEAIAVDYQHDRPTARLIERRISRDG